MKLKHTENAKYQNFTNSTITRRLSGMNCASFGVCAAATLFAISLQSAHAATLVQYDFTGDTLTPTTFLPGITASNFSAANTSGGAFNAANSGPSGAPSYRMIGVNDTVRTDYFSFTTDATVTLNSVTYETFDFYQNTFLSPTKYAVSYTISGGGSEVFVEDAAASVESGGPTNNMFHTVINFADFICVPRRRRGCYGQFGSRAFVQPFGWPGRGGHASRPPPQDYLIPCPAGFSPCPPFRRGTWFFIELSREKSRLRPSCNPAQPRQLRDCRTPPEYHPRHGR
jgi:hypothetical protein